MRFSTFHIQSQPAGSTAAQTLRDELQLMLLAEDLGFHAIWLAEHHFSDWGVCPSPATMLAYVAARTKRLRLGVALSVVPLHDPVQVAEEYALLDVLSDGRLDFGLGRGSHAYEYQGFGVPHAEGTSRLREALQVIRKAWTQERFSHHGEHYHYSDIALVPRPVQSPLPPLYVGGARPDTGIWAAQEGAAAMWTIFANYDQLKERRQQYRQAAAVAGRDAAVTEQILEHAPVQRIIWVAETEQQAKDEMERGVAAYVRIALSHMLPGEVPTFEIPTWEQHLQRHCALVGTADQVVEQLVELQERTGYQHVMCWMSVGGGMPPELVKRSMRLFAEKVMPRLENTRSDREVLVGKR